VFKRLGEEESIFKREEAAQKACQFRRASVPPDIAKVENLNSPVCYVHLITKPEKLFYINMYTGEFTDIPLTDKMSHYLDNIRVGFRIKDLGKNELEQIQLIAGHKPLPMMEEEGIWDVIVDNFQLVANDFRAPEVFLRYMMEDPDNRFPFLKTCIVTRVESREEKGVNRDKYSNPTSFYKSGNSVELDNQVKKYKPGGELPFMIEPASADVEKKFWKKKIIYSRHGQDGSVTKTIIFRYPTPNNNGYGLS
jgi:hypothetical protein